MQAVETRARLRIARGEHAAAAEDLLALGALLTAEGVRNPAFWAWRGQAAIALLGCGRGEEARDHAEDELILARALGRPTALGRALRIAAMTYRTEDALPLYGEACEVLSASPARQELALALVDHGAAMRRLGQRLEARERLREGLDVASACGVDGVAARARGELRATGARLHRERTTGRDALTPSEGRVAVLAAEGMSNRAIAQHLFLSAKTVEMHLGRVYRKLDISGRDQLPAALAARTDRAA